MPSSAETIRCDACGSHFLPSVLASVVACPYCRHAQPISLERLAALQGYEDQVDQQLDHAQIHASQLAQYQRWYGESGNSSTKHFFLLFAACGSVAGLVAALLAALGVIKWEMLPAAVMMGGFMPATFIYYGWHIARWLRPVETAGTDVAGVPVACPTCGAPGVLMPGSAINACAHCRSALIPDAPIMRQGIEAARNARRKVALEHYRKERTSLGQVYQRTSAGNAHLYTLGPFAGMLLIGTVMFTVEYITGEVTPPLRGLLLLWGITGALVGALALSIAVRASRKARFAAALQHLKLQFPPDPAGAGERASGPVALAQWLNRYWCSAFPPQALYVGPYHGLLAFHYAGFPALIDSNPTRTEHMLTRVQVLMAAAIPGVQDPPPVEWGYQMELPAPPPPPPMNQQALVIVNTLRGLGFELEFSEAGLLAKASERFCKDVLRRPELLHTLAPVVNDMSQLLRALNAAPAGALE